MTCNEARKQCECFLDHELRACAADDVNGHLAVCPACQNTFETHRCFNDLLRTALLRRASRHITPKLKKNLLQRLNSDTRAFGAGLRRNWENSRRKLTWTLAACVALVVGIAIYQALCASEQCAVARAAELKFDALAAGRYENPINVSDTNAVRGALQDAGGPESLPDLSCAGWQPTACGRVHMSILPKEDADGVYIHYSQSAGAGQALTVMVLRTPLDVRGSRRGAFMIAQQSDHNVIGWRRSASGPLYLIVSKLNLSDLLPVAEKLAQ